MTRRTPVPRTALVVGLSLALSLTACGSDDDGGDSASATTGPQYEIVSDATVAAGLAASIATMTSLSTAPSTATPEAIDAMFTAWYAYEGTIREQDANAYLAMEDALGAFKKAAEANDQAGLTTALADFSTAASTYLTAHPG